MDWRNQVAVVTGGSRGIGRGNSATLVAKCSLPHAEAAAEAPASRSLW